MSGSKRLKYQRVRTDPCYGLLWPPRCKGQRQSEAALLELFRWDESETADFLDVACRHRDSGRYDRHVSTSTRDVASGTNQADPTARGDRGRSSVTRGNLGGQFSLFAVDVFLLKSRALLFQGLHAGAAGVARAGKIGQRRGLEGQRPWALVGDGDDILVPIRFPNP